MKHRLWVLAAALLGLLATNLHLACSVSFGGETTAGRYSPAAVRRGLAAADAAAVEILSDDGSCARPRLRYSFSLTPPDGKSRFVADAALRATDGVAVLDGVFLDGAQLGTVLNGSRFAGRLQAWLYDNMPRGARHAGFTEDLALRPLYARAGSAQEPEELLAAVTAAAHAWYSDASGTPIIG